MKPLYIFDLDGTLADCAHRRPLLDNKKDKERWSKFYAACDKDTPIQSVIDTYNLLRPHCDIWIFSGRRDSEFNKTLVWFLENGITVAPDRLFMRPTGDTTPDDILKENWLHAMSEADRGRLVASFDDRERVVAMWRRNGVRCFQVAPGDF